MHYTIRKTDTYFWMHSYLRHWLKSFQVKVAKNVAPHKSIVREAKKKKIRISLNTNLPLTGGTIEAYFFKRVDELNVFKVQSWTITTRQTLNARTGALTL